MKKMINKTHIEGLLYESTLEEKVAGAGSKNPGSKYISGKLSIQIADTNIVEVEIFESEITKKGTRNQKYQTLLDIINSASIVKNGIDNAIKLKIDSAFSVRDWYFNDQAGTTLRNFNGFIHIVPTVNSAATFETDMLIVSTTDEMKKKGEDAEPTGSLVVNGYIFDFANKIMPVKFVVDNSDGVNYFKDLEPNTFTKVWGKQVTQQDKTTKVEKSAFGDDKVVEFVSTKKRIIITGVNSVPYEFGDETFLTVDEVKTALADREVYLADVKKRSEEANKKIDNASITNGSATGGFKF